MSFPPSAGAAASRARRRAAASYGVASLRQLLFIDLILMAALLLLWNRARLPEWALPEHHGLDMQRSRAFPAALFPGVDAPFLSAPVREFAFDGHRTLVVGDSMIRRWPWPADRLCIVGGSTSDIARAFRQEIRVRRYEQIILWAGSADLGFGAEAKSYLEPVAAMADLATQHAPTVLLVSPMPFDAFQRELILQFHSYLPRDALPPETVTLMADIVEQLRTGVPDVTLYDVGQMRYVVVYLLKHGEIFEDGIHLTPAGFEWLADELLRAGFDVRH